MNHAYTTGDRVFYFGSKLDQQTGLVIVACKYAIVVSVGRLEDGTAVLELQVEGEMGPDGGPKIVSLPAAAVTLVT
jgi:hypothetical protein